ncbi:MAG: hypothetical protein GKR94_16665 [Gammaproteobacteria bacterium]|nr:hypothetical protein [Gammaproteobacteria bacterium]
MLSWTTSRRSYFQEYPAPYTAIVLELDEGPLFVSYPIDIDVGQPARGYDAVSALDRRRGPARRLQPTRVWPVVRVSG